MACPIPHTTRDQFWLAAGLAAGYAAAALLRRRPRPKTSHPLVHVLVVNLKFGSVAQKEAWKAIWTAVASAVYDREPNCLSYEFCDAVADPCAAIVYERYVSRADLDGPHQSTLASFASTWAEAKLGAIDKTLTHYTESNIGHIDR